MKPTALEELKDQLRTAGYTTKAILPDERMTEIYRILDEHPHKSDTPDHELRYIEGLLHLPMGHLSFFRITTSEERQNCECGRATSALDIVHTAVRFEIHPYKLVRDTLIGFRNVFEFADEGRSGQCYNCGRPVVSFSYWTNKYAYA